MSAALGASRDRISLLALPATLYMAAAFAIPLFLLLITSVTTPQGLSLATYREFFPTHTVGKCSVTRWKRP